MIFGCVGLGQYAAGVHGAEGPEPSYFQDHWV